MPPTRTISPTRMARSARATSAPGGVEAPLAALPGGRAPVPGDGRAVGEPPVAAGAERRARTGRAQGEVARRARHDREPLIRCRRIRSLDDARHGGSAAFLDRRCRDPAAGQAEERDPEAVGDELGGPAVARPVDVGERPADADKAPLGGRGRGGPEILDDGLAPPDHADRVHAQARRAPRPPDHAACAHPHPGPDRRVGTGEVQLDRGRAVLHDGPPARGIEERGGHRHGALDGHALALALARESDRHGGGAGPARRSTSARRSRGARRGGRLRRCGGAVRRARPAGREPRGDSRRARPCAMHAGRRCRSGSRWRPCAAPRCPGPRRRRP